MDNAEREEGREGLNDRQAEGGRAASGVERMGADGT